MSACAPRSARRLRRGATALLLGLLLALVAAGCGVEDRSAGASLDLPATTATSTVPPTSPPTSPPTTPTTAPPTTTAAPPTTAAPAPAGSLSPGARTVYVLGDSVTLGAQSTLPSALAGWTVTVDAKESRRIDQGSSVVAARGGAMGRVLVVHLCTNWGGGDYGAAAERLLGQLQDVERVVWVTCTPWLPAVARADEVIRSLPRSHPEVVVADWAAVSATPGYTYADGLHLRPPGAAALAQVIADAVGPPPAGG